MWTLIVARAAELALALLAALKSVANAVLQWQAIQFGRSAGKAESDVAHAQAERQAEERMQEIADRPIAREELVRRLEEGSV